MSQYLNELSNLFARSDAVEEIGQIATQLALKDADLKRAVKFIQEHETNNPHSILQFSIPGDPPVSKRPRASRIRGADGSVTGIRMHAADGKDQRSMRSEIRQVLPANHIPYAGEVELYLEVYRPMLASWAPYKRLLAELGYIRPDRKPDFDNHAKLVTDAMRGVVFVDDSLVVIGNVSLFYSCRPRLDVTVSGRARSFSK